MPETADSREKATRVRQTLNAHSPHARDSTRLLTGLLVQQDLELIVNLTLQALLDPGDRFLVRQLPVHEPAAA